MHIISREFSNAKRHERQAQKDLFERLSPKMIAISHSYVADLPEAEDIVIKAFYTCFTRIAECRDHTKFESWLRSIVVNESITFLRKKKNVLFVDMDTDSLENMLEEEIDSLEIPMDVQEILLTMPEGYRLIFNLYVFEEKKHYEIAQILNISVGTSKSQLSKAKKWLLARLKNNYYVKNLE